MFSRKNMRFQPENMRFQPVSPSIRPILAFFRLAVERCSERNRALKQPECRCGQGVAVLLPPFQRVRRGLTTDSPRKQYVFTAKLSRLR